MSYLSFSLIEGEVPVTDGGGSLTTDTNQLPAALGSLLSSGSLSVVLSSDHATIPVTTTSDVSLQLPANLGPQLLNESLSITLASDQPAISVNGTVDIRSLQLPIDLGQKTNAASVSVVISSDQSAIPIFGAVTTTLSQLPVTLGPKSAATSTSVTIASDQSAIPVIASGTVTANIGTVSALLSTAANQTTQITSLQLLDDVIATPGSPIVSKSTQISGSDGTNSRTIATNTSGHVKIESSQLPSILGLTTVANSLSVTLASDHVVVPISGTITANMGTVSATLATAAHQVTQTTSLQLLDDVVAVPGSALVGKGYQIAGSDGSIARLISTTNTGRIIIDDGAASITIDGTVSSLQSGTWTIQPGNTPNTVPWLFSLHDGTTKATVRELGVNDALNVAIVDSSGNQITTFGGGHEYIEDVASTGGEYVGLAGFIREDTPSSSTSNSGDYSVGKVDASGRLWVNNSGVTQPVSGTITANMGTVSATLATAAHQVTQTTSLQLIDDVIATPGSSAVSKSTQISGSDGTNSRTIATNTSGHVKVESLQLPSTLGSDVSANSLSITLASDHATVPVTLGQLYIEGSTTLTRPTNTTTYTAGDSLADTTPTTKNISFTLASSGAAIPTGSTIVITSILVCSSHTGATVNPLMDIIAVPATFTTIADNSPVTIAYTIFQTGILIPVDFAMLFGTGGTMAYNNDLALRIKLATGSTSLYFQPRMRLQYVPISGEIFTFKISGFIVQ